MAGRKKETNSQMVAVDAYKLGQALKMTFEGMSLVFDALGTDAGLDGLAEQAQMDGKGFRKKTEPTENDSYTEKDSDADGQPDEPTEDAGFPWDNRTDSAGTGENNGDMLPEKPEAVREKTSAITLDDVTKIIVQKIKKNRNNNEKIGQILKAYGVAKVGELPDSKYEAFLTDLSEL